MRTLALLTSILVVAAVGGCATATVVGEAKGDTDERSPASAPTRPKRPSVIVGANADALVGGSSLVLGDVDGDGFDDFLVEAIEQEPELGRVPRTQTYLFYGRPEFAEQLSVANADASFASDGYAPWPLGDVNGDGLADFALLHQPLAYEIVLGNQTRFEGAHAARTSGIMWVSPVVPALGSPLAFTIETAGDVNCDGTRDVLVHATEFASLEAAPSRGTGTVHYVYIVPGGQALPEGDWDPSWAVARYGVSDADAETWGAPVLSSLGDMNADGCDDLIGFGGQTHAVFYGGSSRFRGQFSPRDADALLKGPGWPAHLPDLDGDGADEMLWMLDGKSEFQVQYGSRKRWSGQQLLTPELKVSLKGRGLAGGRLAIDSGDIDIDGSAELLIGTAMYAKDDDADLNARGALYALRGTGKRVTGTVSLTEAELFFLGPEAEQRDAAFDQASGLGASLSLAGDIDGDGGRDILSGAPSVTDHGAQFLFPSVALAPD